MNVWVVEVGMDYEGSEVIGVFGDRQSAEIAVKAVLIERHGWDYDFEAKGHDPDERTEDVTKYELSGRHGVARRWRVETMR
jgi:hypothetical protein